MEYLFDGVKEFSSNDFQRYKELFESIGKSQSPHTLFIGCSDSRVVPNLITNTLPGDLFVIRNIANIVPYYRESSDFLATTSAIEYAVKVLKIDNILVCGHSNCGGCNAFYLSDEQMAEVPHTKKWIQLARPVIDKVKSYPNLMADVIKREWVTEQLNIIEQMNHLLTYPYIRELHNAGNLNILGWYYLIETGEVFNYDKEKRKFIKIQ